jgi:autophagy-related protein 18
VNNGGVITGHKSGGDDNWMGYLKSAVTSYLPYALPSQVTDVFTQGRAFASATLQIAGLKHSCAITTIQKSLR